MDQSYILEFPIAPSQCNSGSRRGTCCSLLVNVVFEKWEAFFNYSQSSLIPTQPGDLGLANCYITAYLPDPFVCHLSYSYYEHSCPGPSPFLCHLSPQHSASPPGSL